MTTASLPPDAPPPALPVPPAPPAPPAPRPLVSVVIPCYGQSVFLVEAIESVLAQEHARVETIVVDDGSPDDTAAVAARYPAVRYLRQANQGVSAARNAGLRASRGDYVVFLDADDRLLPGALAAGLAAFTAHPECAFVYGEFRFISERGAVQGQRVRHPTTGDLYRALLLRNHIEMLSTVLFRRDVLVAARGFETRLRAAEDYELLLRLARSWPTYAHGALVAEYRRYGRYDTSLSHDPARMLRSTMRVLRAQRRHVRGNADYEAALAHGIRFFQRYYGGELLDQIADLLHHRVWLRAVRRLAIAVCYYPRGIAERLLRRLRQAVHPAGG